MKYYTERYSSEISDCIHIIVMIVITLALVFGTMSCINYLSEPIWNDGQCINCETRYELRGASKGLKYYSCPDCGQEVQRY